MIVRLDFVNSNYQEVTRVKIFNVILKRLAIMCIENKNKAFEFGLVHNDLGSYIVT